MENIYGIIVGSCALGSSEIFQNFPDFIYPVVEWPLEHMSCWMNAHQSREKYPWRLLSSCWLCFQSQMFLDKTFGVLCMFTTMPLPLRKTSFDLPKKNGKDPALNTGVWFLNSPDKLLLSCMGSILEGPTYHCYLSDLFNDIIGNDILLLLLKP